MGWQIFEILMRPMWWRNSITSSLVFAPKLIISAVFFTATILIATATPFWLGSCLSGGIKTAADMSSLLTAMGGLLVALVASLVCLSVALSGWAITLTAFAHAFQQFPASSWSTELATKSQLRTVQNESIAETKRHVAFLTKFWLWATAALAPFFICLVVFAGALAIQVPVEGQPPINFGPTVNVSLIVALVVTVLLVIGLSFNLVVYSSKFDLKPLVAVKETLGRTTKALIPCMILSALAASMHALLGSPGETVQLLSGRLPLLSGESLPMSVVSSVWQGVTSVFLLTLMLTPFCELLRQAGE